MKTIPTLNEALLATQNMTPGERVAYVRKELRALEASDKNIGREWDAPYGRQKIIGLQFTGGLMDIVDPRYEVQTLENFAVRRYPIARIEDVVAMDTYKTTREYAHAQEAEKKERLALLAQEEMAKQEAEKEAAILSQYLDMHVQGTLQKGRVKKTLEMETAVVSRSENKEWTGKRHTVIRAMLAAGYTTETKTVVTDRKQETKKEYRLVCENSIFVVTKTEHDYATYHASTTKPPCTHLAP